MQLSLSVCVIAQHMRDSWQRGAEGNCSRGDCKLTLTASWRANNNKMKTQSWLNNFIFT